MAQSAARLTQTDVRDLDRASNALAAAASMIKRANPAWADGAVQHIVEANNVIVRLVQKGGGAFARYLERHGIKEAPGAPEPAAVDAESAEPPRIVPQED